MEKAVPQLMPIIYELNNRVNKKFRDKSVAIIEDEDCVHMAHIDIHYGFSVNGVAYLHTEILKNSELNNFYKIYPEKFNNKTNGITFRRWLLHCNPELDSLLIEVPDRSRISRKMRSELGKTRLLTLMMTAVLDKLLAVKTGQQSKNLKNYLKQTQNIDIDDKFCFRYSDQDVCMSTNVSR